VAGRAGLFDPLMRSYKISKSLKESEPRAYRRLVGEFRNMSAGGTGGPFLCAHRWTTVRDMYYSDWPDTRFTELLELLGEAIE